MEIKVCGSSGSVVQFVEHNSPLTYNLPPHLSSYVNRSRHEGPALGTDVPPAAARPYVIVVGQIHVKHEFALHRQKRLAGAWRWGGGCLSRLLSQLVILPLLYERNRTQATLSLWPRLPAYAARRAGLILYTGPISILEGQRLLMACWRDPRSWVEEQGPRWHCLRTYFDMHKLAQSTF